MRTSKQKNPALASLQQGLARAMEQKGIKGYKALSVAAGQKENYISSLMRGVSQDPSLFRMLKVAAVLGCTLEELAAGLPEREEYTPPARVDVALLSEATQWVEKVAETMKSNPDQSVKARAIARTYGFLVESRQQGLTYPLNDLIIRTFIEAAEESAALPRQQGDAAAG